METGMPIEGAGEVPRRGPGRPPHSARNVRPDIEEATMQSVRPDTPRPDSLREAEEYYEQFYNKFGEIINENDEFYVNRDSIPEGWDYEWKMVEVAGKEMPYHMMGQKARGWRPVDATRHPELVPTGYQGPIVKKGLMLMEMPTKLANLYRMRNANEAREQQMAADQQLFQTPRNTAPREDFGVHHGRKLNRSVERPNGERYTVTSQPVDYTPGTEE